MRCVGQAAKRVLVSGIIEAGLDPGSLLLPLEG